MSLPGDDRLDELFVRYWDDVLTDAEAEELRRRLATDPACREQFHLFCLQAVVATEVPVGALPEIGAARHVPAQARPAWSRRQLLGYLGGGLAASVAAGFVGWRFWDKPAASPVRLAITTGTVTVRNASGDVIPASGFLPPEATIATFGPVSRARLRYPDGTDISLTGDSVATLADNGQRLLLRQGNAMAQVPAQLSDVAPPTLATSETILTGLGGVVMTLVHVLQATEVGVQRGRVKVETPSGKELADVREGELLTVLASGNLRKQPMPSTPDEFSWDLRHSLPNGWHVGTAALTRDGPVVLPELWFDPYHKAEMYQIRSDSQWARGLFRLFPESVVKVRYWVEKPGPGQVVLCVRTAHTSNPASGVVECNDAFAEAHPRQWQELAIPVKDMLDNIHSPRFGPPWVGFLVIFNTYTTDLGLKIGGFQVERPPDLPAGAP